MDFIEFAKTRGYDEDIVKLSLKLAIEEACRRHYNIAAVNAMLDVPEVTVVFRVPKNIDKKSAEIFGNHIFDDDIVHATLKLIELPDSFKDTVKILFNDALEHFNIVEINNSWRKSKHGLTSGIICSNDGKSIIVDIKNEEGLSARGIMTKEGWVMEESEKYKPGTDMVFYILEINYHPLSIKLSRSAKKFPEKLFQRELPWHKFLCTRRFCGHKSMLKTDAPLNKNITEIIKKIQHEMLGEFIQVNNF